MTDPDEPELKQLIVLSVDSDGTLALDENPLPAWQLFGAATWLAMYAESEMEQEMNEESED